LLVANVVYHIGPLPETCCRPCRVSAFRQVRLLLFFAAFSFTLPANVFWVCFVVMFSVLAPFVWKLCFLAAQIMRVPFASTLPSLFPLSSSLCEMCFHIQGFGWMLLLRRGDVAGSLPVAVPRMCVLGALRRIWLPRAAGVERQLLRPLWLLVWVLVLPGTCGHGWHSSMFLCFHRPLEFQLLPLFLLPHEIT